MAFSSRETAEINVEYTDYVVARGFIEAFDDWISGCSQNQRSKALDFFQKYSEYIPKVTKLIIVSVLLYYSFLSVAQTELSITNSLVIQKLVLIFGAFYLVSNISDIAGKILERNIDNASQLSYVQLNKGDEKLVRWFKKRQRKTIVRFILGSLLAIGLGIISSKLAELI